MPVVYQVLVLLHLVGFAAVFGGGLAQLRAPEVNLAMLYGAWVQLVAGLALLVLLMIGPDLVNYVKAGITLLLEIIVLLLVAKNRKFADIPRGLVLLIVGLTFVDVTVATLWV